RSVGVRHRGTVGRVDRPVARRVRPGPTPRRPQRPPLVTAATNGAVMADNRAPVGDLNGWRQVFVDDFDTDVPLGKFPAAVSTKWGAYLEGWKDTSKHGTYSPGRTVSIAGGVLTKRIRTDTGVPLVCALTPKLAKPFLYGRFAVRARFDKLPGYKAAWLLWPDVGDNNTHVDPVTKLTVPGGEGEIDFPEMDLDSASLGGFMHRTGVPADQYAMPKVPVDITQWHDYV